jgi:hypothetical protein
MWHISLHTTMHIQNMIIVNLFNVVLIVAQSFLFSEHYEVEGTVLPFVEPLNATKNCWPFTCYLRVHVLQRFLWKLIEFFCTWVLSLHYYKDHITLKLHFLSPLTNFCAVRTTEFCSRCDMNDNGRYECSITVILITLRTICLVQHFYRMVYYYGLRSI